MRVADSQCGVVTVAQALTCMSRGEIRARVEAGRWQRPHRGVLVTHNGPLTADQEMWVCLLAAAQQGVTVPVRLRNALTRRGPCARHALIDETIADAEGGIHSLPEKEFDQILRGHGLPPPTRQRAVRRPDGRRLLQFASYAVRHLPTRVGDQVERGLRRGGFTPE